MIYSEMYARCKNYKSEILSSHSRRATSIRFHILYVKQLVIGINKVGTIRSLKVHIKKTVTFIIRQIVKYGIVYFFCINLLVYRKKNYL